MRLLFLELNNEKKNKFTNNFLSHDTNLRASAMGGLLPIEEQWAT